MIDVQEITKLIALVGIQIVVQIVFLKTIRDTACLGMGVRMPAFQRQSAIYSLFPVEPLTPHSGGCAAWGVAGNTPHRRAAGADQDYLLLL